MAEKKEAEAAKDGAKAGSGKLNRKLLMLLGVGAATLALLGGGAWYFLKPQSAVVESADAGKEGEKKKDDKKEDKKVPYFVELEAFTVNLKDPERFLQIKLTFQTKTAEGAEQLKDYMPIVRSAVIPVLGSQDAAGIVSKEGKDRMSGEIVRAANESLARTAAADAIDAVLITHMIIQ